LRTNDILTQVTRHSTLLELQVLSRVARPWRDAARTAAPTALLDHQFNSQALLRLVGFSPPECELLNLIVSSAVTRMTACWVNRIVSSATDDRMLMDPGSFRTVIEIQLALQRVRRLTPFPHRVGLGRVVDLLVGTAGPGLSTEHPLVRQALESMDVSRERLALNVANTIPHLQRAWRNFHPDQEPGIPHQHSVDWVCIRNLLLTFSYFPIAYCLFLVQHTNRPREYWTHDWSPELESPIDRILDAELEY
jgi:hypothetical protein